ncbi:MAG: transporter substrate-binding domain-containing protein [Gammaproteobacteria bacterium]|nr:transporter substrate-binding domain-containing protein [Gammaproteobacteria bacterium]
MKYIAVLWLCGVFFSSQARELIACGHPDYPPVSWAENNRLVGVAPTVVRQLFKELGYEVKLQALGNWKRCLLEVSKGRADIVVAAYHIKSREPFLDFSTQPIMADPIGIFVNSDKISHYQSQVDLKGKTTGLLLGDSFGDQFDRFIKQHTKIEYVSQGQQNFEKLALARIDFMPIGISTGALQSQKLGYQQQISLAPLTINTEHYFLALGRGSKLSQHLPYLNRRLSELEASGEIKRLITKFSQRYLKLEHQSEVNIEAN